MYRFRLSRQLLVATGICALLLGAATVQAQQYDNSQPYDQSQAYDNSDQAPGRVARLAYLSGQVQFAPAGESDWGSVEVNRPMVIGDRLLTGGGGRAVLELGDASVRIDNDSAFDFLNLAQDNVQIELSQGTLNLAVRQLAQGENFEVDTPTVAFVASTPGSYRIDDDPSGTGSMVTVFQGSGTVYGENGVSRQVAAGTSYRFNDSTLASVDANGLPQSDDFDRFCEARDANYNRYAQQEQQYVPPDMIGSDDLDQYGQWNDVPEYGNVWYPNSVPSGWAPYRSGHWAWIDPWGWTWVDDQPWGFAPFHYGRWAYIGNRWGWMPGPVDVQPVYAPALVAFIGGSGFSLSIGLGGGGPVGWFPLGPRDVYMPWFHASRNYFNNVNITNIRNVYINKTVINNYYNDYQAGRVPLRGGRGYAYRNMPGAVTAVPRNVFTGARPVRPAVLKLNHNQLARTEVALRPGVNPDRNSLGLRHPTGQPTTIRGREPFARPVVARHQPPPRPADFAARQKVIASQHGQPLTAAQMQDLRKSRPAPVNDRVKLVPAIAGA
ncbi:MAG: FecR domain-containing protein, partial [Xanthomonadaceae bacterium]|nr:FecR domain-containing protein [Xanthomonadaceae bacterium]